MTRRFDGGSIAIHPSRIPGQLYVIVRFNSRGRRFAARDAARKHLG